MLFNMLKSNTFNHFSMHATLFLVYTVAYYDHIMPVLKTHVNFAQLSLPKGQLIHGVRRVEHLRNTVKALYYAPLYYGQSAVTDTQKIPDL